MIIKNLDLRILDFVKCIFSQSLLSSASGSGDWATTPRVPDGK